MCCCPQPNVNGTPGAYSWDGKGLSTYPVNPPALQDGDELLFDEPGRCGGLDSHSHHLRLVRQRHGGHALLVRHGGGDVRIPLGYSAKPIVETAGVLDSNARYWLLLKISNLICDAARDATAAEATRWSQAFVDGRIKKGRARAGRYRVTIKTKPEVTAQGKAWSETQHEVVA